MTSRLQCVMLSRGPKGPAGGALPGRTRQGFVTAGRHVHPPIDSALGEWTAVRPPSLALRHRGTLERQWFESPRMHYTWQDEQHGRNDLQTSR